jgi:predicted nucleotidyltransferase
LNLSVLKWPDRSVIDQAVRSWALAEIRRRTDIVQFGYFGSYARDDWGVGSDLDLIAVVDETSIPFERRSFSWDLNSLPVPAELIVYTADEWQRVQEKETRFSRMLKNEVVWIYSRID